MANKVAAVTGASRGIGKGIALALAGHGYDIAFSYCSAQEEAVPTELLELLGGVIEQKPEGGAEHPPRSGSSKTGKED